MTDEKKKLTCPNCRSNKTVRNGHHKATNTQKVLCRNCGKHFRKVYRYKGYQTQSKIERVMKASLWESAKPQRTTLDSVPIGIDCANAFVLKHHRHHPPVAGHKFSIGCSDGKKLVGVAIVGRPVARHLDDGLTLEVTRCCTDGTKNAASQLYGAARRAAFALGYLRLITYTQACENGASLKASGFLCAGLAGGGNWNVPSRRREDKHPVGVKHRWEAYRA